MKGSQERVSEKLTKQQNINQTMFLNWVEHIRPAQHFLKPSGETKIKKHFRHGAWKNLLNFSIASPPMRKLFNLEENKILSKLQFSSWLFVLFPCSLDQRFVWILTFLGYLFFLFSSGSSLEIKSEDIYWMDGLLSIDFDKNFQYGKQHCGVQHFQVFNKNKPSPSKYPSKRRELFLVFN